MVVFGSRNRLASVTVGYPGSRTGSSIWRSLTRCLSKSQKDPLALASSNVRLIARHF